MDETRRSSNESNGSNSSSRDSKSFFIRTIIPFLLLQFSVGLCASLQATFYPIEATLKGATASQFGAVFGIIHLSLFMFGEIELSECHHLDALLGRSAGWQVPLHMGCEGNLPCRVHH